MPSSGPGRLWALLHRQQTNRRRYHTRSYRTPKSAQRAVCSGRLHAPKWKTSIQAALKQVPPHLLDEQATHQIIWEVWQRWQSELTILRDHQIPHCYFPKETKTTSIQLHGFSDTSEMAYGETTYLTAEDSNNNMHITLVKAKTRVAPIKHFTFPRLELFGPTFPAHIVWTRCDYITFRSK